MKILLDTHLALWSIADSKKLPAKAAELLRDEENDFFISIASIWEVAIKHYLHPDENSISEVEYSEYCRVMGFNILSLKVEHIFALRTLQRPENAPKHNDPFDRIMIAQAKTEQIIFLTHDLMLPYYWEKSIMFI